MGKGKVLGPPSVAATCPEPGPGHRRGSGCLADLLPPAATSLPRVPRAPKGGRGLVLLTEEEEGIVRNEGPFPCHTVKPMFPVYMQIQWKIEELGPSPPASRASLSAFIICPSAQHPTAHPLVAQAMALAAVPTAPNLLSPIQSYPKSADATSDIYQSISRLQPTTLHPQGVPLDPNHLELL
ncbi:hypothetical protein CB1_001113012 [Camelus ferus]|nr:hypothetical protein CB1_001113012 [Camelus ferus]